jgi:muconate cycloisomerase
MGGHRWFKLKPNGNLDADIETMVKVRQRTRPDVRFFMDANFSLKMDPDAAVRYINALAPYGLAVYEDPLDVDLPTSRAMQDRLAVRLMLDFRARTPADVMAIVQHRAARAINIHADWASGFAPALTKARIARLGGLETLIGSTFYCGPGAAAYQTLAAAIPGWHICEQTNAAEDVKRIAVRREYPTIDGKIHLSDAPGLGVEVDPQALEAMTVKEVTVQ